MVYILCATAVVAQTDQVGERGARSARRADRGCWQTADSLYRRKVALVVGIDRYTQVVGRLRTAVADAKAIKELLEADLGFDEVVLLIDEEASRTSILRSIIRLKEGMSFEDQFFFFFAGHGLTFGHEEEQVCYLLSQDVSSTNESAVASEALSMADLRERLLRLPAKHVLLVIDSCFSGCVADTFRGSDPEAANPTLCKLASRRARQVITAGGSRETVRERPEWGHSALTSQLIDALRGRVVDPLGERYQDLVTARSLHAYIRNEVARMTEGEQVPLFADLGQADEGEFLFLLSGDGQAKRAQLGVHTRVLVIIHGATIFATPHGSDGTPVPFMKMFFLQQGETPGRIPVASEPNSPRPEGWLRKYDAVIWAGNEVFVLHPAQAGQVLELWSKPECALVKTQEAGSAECEPHKVVLQGRPFLGVSDLPMPIFERRAEAIRAGFVVEKGVQEVGVATEVPIGGFNPLQTSFVQAWIKSPQDGPAAGRPFLFLRQSSVVLVANQLESAGIQGEEALKRATPGRPSPDATSACEEILRILSGLLGIAENTHSWCGPAGADAEKKQIFFAQAQRLAFELRDLLHQHSRRRVVNGSQFALLPPEIFEVLLP